MSKALSLLLAVSLLGSFGTVGQGPGEVEQSSYFSVNSRDEVFNLDARRNTVTTYSASGEIRGQVRLPPALIGAIPVDNGNFVATEDETEPDSGFEEMTWKPELIRHSSGYRVIGG